METRQIDQAKIWMLHLNPMRANTESKEMVAVSDNKEKLIKWYNDEKADEPYYSIGDNHFPAKGDMPENKIEDQKFYKVFKKGSVLEWFNPLDNEERMNDEDGTHNHYGHGLYYEWVNEDVLENVKSENQYFLLINYEKTKKS